MQFIEITHWLISLQIKSIQSQMLVLILLLGKLTVIVGRIQTENGTIQMLWVPQEMSPKLKNRKIKLLLSDKFLEYIKSELLCVLVKRTS